ncbi:MAG: SLATT domain-containing protein [Hyphomicrobiaceae bacterium]
MSNHGPATAQGYQTGGAQAPAGPRVVAAGFGPSPLQRLKDKHISDWKLVKRARFNAAKRLERKHYAGIVTLAIVALYGGLISVFNLMFKHRVSADLRDVLEYVAVVSSWLTLIIGLTEQQKNHSANARELHDCGQAVNDLQKQLSAAPIASERDFAPYLGHYRAIMERCRPNHDDVDYRLAEVTPSREERQALQERGEWDDSRLRRERRWAQMRYDINTYLFYASIWFTPALVGMVLWWLVPAAPGAGGPG